MSNKLPAGMYLVGRRDGTVEPFFARITPSRDLLTFGVDDVTLDASINSPHRYWWWRPMVVGELPSDRLLAEMPPHHHEDKGG